MREPDGYREQLERLTEKFPGKEALTMQEACSVVGCHRRTLLSDKSFPAKRIGKRGIYAISIVKLAWWMAKA